MTQVGMPQSGASGKARPLLRYHTRSSAGRTVVLEGDMAAPPGFLSRTRVDQKDVLCCL